MLKPVFGHKHFRKLGALGALLIACVSVQADTLTDLTTDLTTKSDEELTAMSANWGTLSPGERRALLAEVRTRMADKRAGGTGAAPPRIAVERRYGRIVRQSNGSVVVETRVVRRATRPGGTVTFGFGFERRAGAGGVSEPQPATTQERGTEPVDGARLVKDD